jgi:molecular chaperone Hsp33
MVMFKDSLTIATSPDSLIRVYSVTAANIVREAQRIHTTSPIASVVLGRMLVAASLMSSSLKNPGESITVQMKGDGPAGSIVAISDANGNPRGYISNPDLYPTIKNDGKMDLSEMVGNGVFQVIKDQKMERPYIGNVEIIWGEVGDEVSSYYAVSEQIPTVCALGVIVDRQGIPSGACGYLAQLMPGAGTELISDLENHVRSIARPGELIAQNLTSAEIAQLVLNKKGTLHTTREICYICSCSQERVLRMLSGLDQESLREMANDDKDTEITCNFCDAVYTFQPEVLQKMLRTKQ